MKLEIVKDPVIVSNDTSLLSYCMNFSIFKVSSLNLLLSHLLMPLYILALIIVIIFNLYYSLSKYSINRLQKYETFIRIITRISRSSNIPLIPKSLHWLLVKYRINFKLRCITQRALSLGESHYLNSLLIHRLNSHSLRSSSLNLLMLPIFNKIFNDCRSFAYAASFLWNHLSNNVRSSHAYLCLRKNLKTYFFNRAFLTKTA